MKKCGCDHGNCCHHEKTQSEIKNDPETGLEFKRTICADCGKWLSDQILPR
jgi:hypothetical protein